MLNSNIYKTLLNREGFVTMLWATAQQLVVASSTYFIISAIRESTEGHYDESIHFALAFVASLIIVFIPNTLSVIYLEKWRFASIAGFVHEFVARNAGFTTWAHARDKTKFESWLTNESGTVYENGLHLIYDLYQILISTILNILVISVAIDPRISFWYLAAGVVLAVANQLFRKKIAEAALQMQNNRRSLSNTMLSAWENIFVGNKYNLLNWTKEFTSSMQMAGSSAVNYERTRILVSSFAVTLALIIIATGNGMFLSDHKGDLPALAALLVTLPRQLQVVQNIFAFFGYLLGWEGVRTQFKELESVLRLRESSKDIEKFINLKEITFSDLANIRQFESLSHVEQAMLSRESGRFTLRGKNGAGKSTLLSLLAERTGDRSFFLPSHYVGLKFSNPDVVSLSDGNRLLGVLSEIKTMQDVKFILMDEWDANLDSKNIEYVDSVIEELARERVVIESRHRA